jgi:hypothetical protein
MTLEKVKILHLLGLRLQFRFSPSKYPNVTLNNWHDVLTPSWRNGIEYRIHPEDLKYVYPDEHK